MTHRYFHLAVGLVFAAVALLHLARISYDLTVVVGGEWALPMWVSWPGLFVTGFLSFWALHIWDTERRRRSQAQHRRHLPAA